MADLYGLDPARIGRLRSPERLSYFEPQKIWQTLAPPADGTFVDIGAGVGFVTLPLARAYPGARIIGCDILDGMVKLLAEDAAAQDLGNLETQVMAPAHVDLADDTADLIVMAQLHHELDDAPALMAECRRLLKPGGTVAVVDWSDEENGKSPPKGRRVPPAVIAQDLRDAGFTEIREHSVYDYHSFISGRA